MFFSWYPFFLSPLSRVNQGIYPITFYQIDCDRFKTVQGYSVASFPSVCHFLDNTSNRRRMHSLLFQFRFEIPNIQRQGQSHYLSESFRLLILSMVSSKSQPTRGRILQTIVYESGQPHTLKIFNALARSIMYTAEFKLWEHRSSCKQHSICLTCMKNSCPHPILKITPFTSIPKNILV